MTGKLLHGIRAGVLSALTRLSLLRPTYRLYEAVRALRGGFWRSGQREEAFPLPSAMLRTVVAGTPDLDWFLATGRAQAAMVAEAIERQGAAVAQLDRLLDFGCGCGRVLRHWSGLAGRVEIYGSDYNPRLIRWCAANLPFAHFSVNDLQPPLSFDDEFFDVVYALSVVTHLPEPLGRLWIAELSRVLRPGGLLLLTTHGDSYLDRLTAEEQAQYLAGALVVRRPAAAGTNLCTVFHPEQYVRNELAPDLSLLEFVPQGAAIGWPGQDLVVFKRSSREASRAAPRAGGARTESASPAG